MHCSTFLSGIIDIKGLFYYNNFRGFQQNASIMECIRKNGRINTSIFKK